MSRTESSCQCGATGWVCAGTGKPADFKGGTCCEPGWSEYGYVGPGCPSANGCPAGCLKEGGAE